MVNRPTLTPVTIQEVEAAGQARRRAIFVTGLVSAVVLTLIGSALVLSDQGLYVIAVMLVFVPIVVWRYPSAGVTILLWIALDFEAFPEKVFVTGGVPLLKNLPGIHFTPTEFLMVAIVLVLLIRALNEGTLQIRRTPLLVALLGLMAFVLFAEVEGLSRGANINTTAWEIRPWIYLFVLYFVAAQMVRNPRLPQMVLWVIVIVSGIKGIQGTILYLPTLGRQSRPETLLDHEEALMLGCFLILTTALWVFGRSGWLRRTATLLAPFVLAAEIGNDRRTAWIILALGVLAVGFLGWVSMPERRGRLAVAVAVVAVVLSVYVPAFWTSTSSLARPVQAFRSVSSPDYRNQASNDYRDAENRDLEYNIKKTTPVGMGFGIKYQTPIPLIDVSKIDPLIAYIPHNTILYLWWRVGLGGFIVFWAVIGTGIIGACALVRARRRGEDPSDAMLGALVVGLLLGYLAEAWFDQGMTSVRIAIETGALLGVMDGVLLRRMALFPDSASRRLPWWLGRPAAVTEG